MESIEEIRKLLDRFYLGETTLEEEKILQEYFTSGSIPEELLPDRDLFRALGEADDSVAVPEGLNQKILNVIVLRTKRAKITKHLPCEDCYCRWRLYTPLLGRQ